MTSPDAQAKLKADTVEKLLDLHARLLRCWDQGTGKPKLRRPNRLEPTKADATAVISAAVALERTIPAQPSSVATDGEVEGVARAIYESTPDLVPWDDLYPVIRENMRRKARAAIAAQVTKP